jgi:hypothetical protein
MPRAAAILLACFSFSCWAPSVWAASPPAPDRLAKQVDLPFKLSWGESSERIERMLKGAAARVVSKKQERGAVEAWEVEEILIEALRKTVFRFQNGQLIGLELQYRGATDPSGRETWSEQKYDDFMARWRRNFDSQYGPGKLITRKTGAEGVVSQTLSGYRWTVGNTNVDVISFTAERGPDRFHTLSVHYRVF